jgi:hypothetical protein
MMGFCCDTSELSKSMANRTEAACPRLSQTRVERLRLGRCCQRILSSYPYVICQREITIQAFGVVPLKCIAFTYSYYYLLVL